MNSYSQILLIISTFLAINIILCQTYKNEKTNEFGALLNVILNDRSHSSKDIGKDSSKLNFVYGYFENNDQKKRQVVLKKMKIVPNEHLTKSHMIPMKHTTIRSKIASSQYIKMKYKLYHDINELRVKHSVPKLKVDVKLSKKLQKYVEGLVKKDFTHKYQKLQPEDMFYIVKKGEKYDPIGYWSKELEYFKPKEKAFYRIPFIKLIWKSSTHIGCGISGADNSRGIHRIVVYCRIYPVGDIEKEFSENVFLNRK
uniref:SCP domain-containing protein n=1 Tax=Strongyloides venezuelensis TaxID=75913 RepID=A0A0K0EZW3_STRVS